MRMKLLCSLLFTICCFTLQAQEESVMRAELPSGVRKFLAKNFRSPFHHAIKQQYNNNTIYYNIVLNDQTKIEFTQDGTWKTIDGKGKPVKCKFLGKDITNYVLANYPTEGITRVEAGKSQYKLHLTDGTLLKFDMNGSPVKKG